MAVEVLDLDILARMLLVLVVVPQVDTASLSAPMLKNSLPLDLKVYGGRVAFLVSRGVLEAVRGDSLERGIVRPSSFSFVFFIAIDSEMIRGILEPQGRPIRELGGELEVFLHLWQPYHCPLVFSLCKLPPVPLVVVQGASKKLNMVIVISTFRTCIRNS